MTDSRDRELHDALVLGSELFPMEANLRERDSLHILSETGTKAINLRG